MNFTKKALLGLLILNLIVGSQVVAHESNESEEQEEVVVNKKAIVAATLLGAGIAAYYCGAFDEDAFLRNNKVSDYIAQTTAPTRAYVAGKCGVACDYVANKTAPVRTYISDKALNVKNALQNKYALIKRYLGLETLKVEPILLDIPTNTLSEVAQEVVAEVAKEAVIEEAPLSFFQRILQHIARNTDLDTDLN